MSDSAFLELLRLLRKRPIPPEPIYYGSHN